MPPAASSQRAEPAESSSRVRYHRSTSGTVRVFCQNARIEAARAFLAAGSTVPHARKRWLSNSCVLRIPISAYNAAS
jgi:hypothetical protein